MHVRSLAGPLSHALVLALSLEGCQTSDEQTPLSHQPAPRADSGAPDPVERSDAGEQSDAASPAQDSGQGAEQDSGPDSAQDAGQPQVHQDPGTKLKLTLSKAKQAELDALNAELGKLSGLTTDALLAKHPLQFTQSLGYDPRAAAMLDVIQRSAFKLNEAELQKLAAQGFVITPRNQFPHMLYGYQSIYAEDLPVFISLDSILDAVHVSYDRILSTLESSQLIADLRTLITDAQSHLKDAGLSATAARDLDVYFGVALVLLDNAHLLSVFSENAEQVSKLASLANRAGGIEEVELFGVRRKIDGSQFKPRSHYTETPELSRYFRAMMWLGRTDFRIIEPLGEGGTVFRRRQLEAVLALASVVKGPGRAAYDRIDQAVTAFVGEHDYMQLGEVDALLTDLGGAQGVQSRSDAQIAQLIIEKGYGAQRIASQVIFKTTPDAEPLPLGASFALLGQRYAVDSEVFSNVVYDRVPETRARRSMPSPLDAAYAALHNPAALPLLRPELDKYAYAPQLERVRSLVEAHGADYWDGNLYNLWLSALRAISPAEGAQDPAAAGMPALAGTEAWSRRLLNTQLGSWSELRHDTLLYVKQSYTTGAVCEFPDAYVDPYPEAFARLEAFALKGNAIAGLFSGDAADSVRVYFEHLAQVAGLLHDMAEQEQTGVPFGPEQMAFLNDAVRMQLGTGCGAPTTYSGWYLRLLFGGGRAGDMDPTIADVHTDPLLGAPIVLHVATGLPRLMVVTRESCSGPRAYAGLVFAYHELIKPLPRLSDEDWAPLAPTAEDAAFMKPILP